MSGHVLSARSGELATVSLSNPGKLNAVDYDMWRELASVMSALSQDESLRCIVIRGEGTQAFAAGGDIEEFRTRRATRAQALHYHGTAVAGALRAIAECRHPTLALIHGSCVGGGLEIAAACDLRIAGHGARFGAPINRLGFSMYPGELAGLLALAGPAVALELLLEGRLLSADEACAKGLVTRVVPDADLEQEVAAAARRIAAGAPLAARAHKRLVRRLAPLAAALSAEEIDASFDFLDSDDYREGMDAFLHKRPPHFGGR